MKSFFAKNYFGYSALILAIFCITGIVFTFQINQFETEEKQDELRTSAALVSEQTQYLIDYYSYTLDRLYQMSIKQISTDSNVTIIVTDLNGDVIILSNTEYTRNPNISKVDSDIINTINRDGSYHEVGTFNSLFSDQNHVLGIPVTSSITEKTSAYIFVATSAEDAVGLLRDVMNSFFIIIFFALVTVLIMSYFIASRITRPLKIMANASKRFAHGDFNVRVAENNNCTEIDELAISFNNMATSLEQLEELSRSFVANVSHELKTPMTSIGGFVDGMIDGTIPTEKHNKYLLIISEEVRRLSRLVIRMLDAAKLQSGELTLRPVSFDLCEVAMRIALSFETQINNKGVEVEVDLCDRLVITGDEEHLFRAIYNLVDNAVKFVDDGGLLGMKIYKEGNYACVSISNSGAKISENDLPHLFDRFYKTDRSRSKDKTGVGLGLYLVKNIINLHGGDISVSSDDERTTFSFELPIKN